MTRTTCFDVFEQCVLAIQAGELIESVSARDKEFHFQNWFQKRLQKLALHFEGSGWNTYPDFCLVMRSKVSPGQGANATTTPTAKCRPAITTVDKSTMCSVATPLT